MIEKIEDELSRAAKERWKEQRAEAFGQSGYTHPQCNLYEYQTKEVVGEAVCMM